MIRGNYFWNGRQGGSGNGRGQRYRERICRHSATARRQGELAYNLHRYYIYYILILCNIDSMKQTFSLGRTIILHMAH